MVQERPEVPFCARNRRHRLQDHPTTRLIMQTQETIRKITTHTSSAPSLDITEPRQPRCLSSMKVLLLKRPFQPVPSCHEPTSVAHHLRLSSPCPLNQLDSLNLDTSEHLPPPWPSHDSTTPTCLIISRITIVGIILIKSPRGVIRPWKVRRRRWHG